MFGIPSIEEPSGLEITLTTVANGKTSHVGSQVMAVPTNRICGEGMSDEELIDKFLVPKLGGAK